MLDSVEAQVYYNYADHVMDNYSLRTPSGTGMMAGPMASNVDRRTLGGRIKATWRWADVQLIGGLDAQTNEHRQRGGAGIDTYKNMSYTKDADFHNYGAFGELTWYAADRDRLISGARRLPSTQAWGTPSASRTTGSCSRRKAARSVR